MEQPQPLPAPTAALWSGHLSRGSARAHPLPKGGPGLVAGAELGLGLHWSTCCAGPLRCSCLGCGCLPAAGHAQGSHTTGGCQGVCKPWPRPRRKWNSPHTSPWCWVNSQPGAHSAPCGSRMAVILSSTGLRLCWGTTGEHQVTAQGCARACFGSPGHSPGEARSREVCSHQYHIRPRC